MSGTIIILNRNTQSSKHDNRQINNLDDEINSQDLNKTPKY